MALLVLVSTLSLTIEKHYCADNLVDVAVFTEAKGCCAAAKAATSESKEDGCCKNEVDLIKGQDELSLKDTESFKSLNKTFLVAVASVFGTIFPIEDQTPTPKDVYTPPKLFDDLYQLHEVYLI